MNNNIGGYLTKRAFLNPNLEAIYDYATQRRFNFAELNERANRVANVALDAGVKKGDRVALLLMNSVEFVESFFGLAKIGAVVVPLNWRLVPDELAYIVKDAGATVMVYGSEFADSVADLHERGEAATDIHHWYEVGVGGDCQSFAAHYETDMAKARADEVVIAAGDDDLVFIMYTSGTTGLPKGAMHSHATMTWALVTIGATADARFKDRYAIALPLFHVGALTPVIGNIYLGCTTVLMRQFDPRLMWKIIEQESISTTLAVPAMLNFMLQVPELQTADYSSLRWIMSGATPVPVTLIERYAELGIEIHQVYGLTECGGPACLISPDEALAHIGSTGKSFFHTDVRVVSPHGENVAPGEPGEVIIRAQHNMLGYWNQPEATKEAFKDGWLLTGDVALIDEDGFITIHDRIKDMVISGGENIYPAELEDVILSHPEVREVAVIGQPSERWGESPFAVIVRAPDATLDTSQLLAYCATRLASFKLPQGAAFVDEIPRNPTGKALKRLLRETFPGPAPQ
ncbi:MAG: long-chain-fatty-acid--CoA ligase [Chromatiales bacterium]|nr:long-chain-fatty-acid--CoA ligase [Chromatiales bacterium]